MVDALDSKSSSPKSVGSSPTAGIKNLDEKSGSFPTAALSFSAVYASNRDIVRHLRYALRICPTYAHFKAPVYAHFFGALTGSIRPYLSDCFRCPQGVWEGMRKNCVLWQKKWLACLEILSRSSRILAVAIATTLIFNR